MKSPVSILLLEDDPADARIIADTLAEGGIDTTIERVESREAFEAALRRGGFDLILGDYRLPAFDGLTALSLALQQRPDVPFILVSGVMGEEAAIEGLKAGATDYVLKQRLSRLAGVVSRALTDAEERRARRVAEEAVRESEGRYRAIFENMASGSCLDEVIYESGRAVDYRVLDINPAFERIVGITRREVVGVLASEIYGISDVPFLDVYSKVAETGEPAEFEAHFAPIHKDLHITVGCPGPGRFSTVFSDITERKRAEVQIRDQLEELLRWQDVILDREERVEELKRQVNELSRRLGEAVPYPSQEPAGHAGQESARDAGEESAPALADGEW
jgi:PAS domain S-box-containing protein